MICTPIRGKPEDETMFELAAGQLHQEERERTIAEALRRRRLLETDGAQARTPIVQQAFAKAPRRDALRSPARAGR
jgi:hypothetical protein